MMFLFPRWDMLIPWRVFSSYRHVGFSGLDPQHLRALQVDGRRSLFDQFDPRPKRDSWHQCSGAIPTVGGAEIRKDHQLRWRINPIIYRVFLYISGDCLGFLPSTVAPENQWLEDETSFWNDLKWSLSGEHVKLSFREGIHPEIFSYGSPENKPPGVSGNSFWFNYYYYFVVQNGVISGGCSPQPRKSARWAP